MLPVLLSLKSLVLVSDANRRALFAAGFMVSASEQRANIITKSFKRNFEGF